MKTRTRVYSFPRGGIRFEDPSMPPRDASVIAFLPTLSIIPLVQHTGDRVSPVVSVGDSVKEGMLVGRGRGLGSANVHATVPGKVVRTVSWKTLEGYTNDALVIRMEGTFSKLGRREETVPWKGLSSQELQRLISYHGIVEMESTGFPVSDTLSAFRDREEPFTLVVRCVFDDPWLVADYVLCRERLKAVVEGSVIAARTGNATRIIYAVSQDKQALGDLFLAESAAFDIPASVAIVGSRYPQHNRRELEMVLQMYVKKEGFELGAMLLLGPATLAAIHDAVTLKRPILDRYVAVGGSAVKNPQVMKVRIGTRIGELFAQCGGFTGKPKRIATGSPLQGRTVLDLDEPILRTNAAVFALLEEQIGGTRTRNCINCGECRSVCPVGLDPEELFKAVGSSANSIREEGRQTADVTEKCHGCGCCEVVCPSRLPLSTVISNSIWGGRNG